MNHRILTAAQARLGLTSASAPAIIASQPAPAPLASAPAAPAEGEGVDVVTVADAQAAVAAAEIRGQETERARTSAVLASDAGKAQPAMAAWMLHNNPGASADAIVAQLATMPAGTVAAAPVATEQAAAPAAAPAAAITTPLTNTPLVNVGADAHAGGEQKTDQKEIDALWDSGIAAASAMNGNKFGEDIAPGIPRTGN